MILLKIWTCIHSNPFVRIVNLVVSESSGACKKLSFRQRPRGILLPGFEKKPCESYSLPSWKFCDGNAFDQKKLGFSLVVSFYGSDMSLLPQDPAWRERYQILFDEAALFLVKGIHMQQELINFGCPEKKIRVQHLGGNLDEHLFSPRKIGDDGKIRILVVGTFREKKVYRTHCRHLLKSLKNTKILRLPCWVTQQD